MARIGGKVWWVDALKWWTVAIVDQDSVFFASSEK